MHFFTVECTNITLIDSSCILHIEHQNISYPFIQTSTYMYNAYRYQQVLIQSLWVFPITFCNLSKYVNNKFINGCLVSIEKKCPDTDMCPKIFLYDIHVATLTRLLLIPSRYCQSLPGILNQWLYWQKQSDINSIITE